MTSNVVRVEAVCTSGQTRRVAKTPRPEALIEQFGLADDRHAGEWARPALPNRRQWSAVSTDDVAAFCAELGVPPFAPGAMGENLRLAGVALGELRAGTLLEFPSGARLRVLAQNDPCQGAAGELAETYGESVRRYFVKAAFGRRGVLGVVEATGIVRPGDEVRVLPPA